VPREGEKGARNGEKPPIHRRKVTARRHGCAEKSGVERPNDGEPTRERRGVETPRRLTAALGANAEKKREEKKLNEGRATHRCAFRHRVIVRGTIKNKGSFRCGNEKTKLGNRGGGAGRGDEMANAAISMGTCRILSLRVVVVVTPRGFFADAFRPLGCGGSGEASLLYRLCRGFTQAVGTDRGLRIGAERGASRHTVVVVKRLHHDLWQ